MFTIGNILKSNSGSGLRYIVAEISVDGVLHCLDAKLDGSPCASNTSSGPRYRTTKITPQEFGYFRFEVIGNCDARLIEEAMAIRARNADADRKMFEARD